MIREILASAVDGRRDSPRPYPAPTSAKILIRAEDPSWLSIGVEGQGWFLAEVLK